MLSFYNFTAQKKRFSIDRGSIEGIEEDKNGTILCISQYRDDKNIHRRILIDESYEVAFDRINNIDPWEEGSMVRELK